MVRILLVEDNQQDAKLVKEALRDSTIEHDLRVVSSGEDALCLLNVGDFKPSIVFLDLNLPRMGGLELLKEVKKDVNLRAIPIVILTNSRSEDDVTKAYANYCNAYVRKPLGFDQLLSLLDKTCSFWFCVATLPSIPSY